MKLSTPVVRKVHVGLIGCGEIAQVVHIPTLNFLSDLFQITYLCDISRSSLTHCKAKVIGLEAPETTTDPEELCASPRVDVVFKPMALNDRDTNANIEAEKVSEGRVMVGYMRRFAPAFEDAIREIGGMDKILYARVRDIIGPNATFVEQSGTFPQKATDSAAEYTEDRNARSGDCLPGDAEGGGQSAIFEYPTFSVTYEPGLDSVPRFDAHIEVYSATKTVRVQYDSPYIKGLPITMHVQENIDSGFKESVIRRTYEDPYTTEMKELYAMMADGKAIKTTAEDAKKDLETFRMLVRSASTNGK
ncbi:hypothetical protein PENARI_c048G04172 [Penicillium arizonense]|uniref:Gfo/Idh/MocA-like oxidoreductase N-terminal domain-containing protein n=1 Tax=Penicillium arizonense TaxID=1835702 RepID=A0A1F5L2Z2_PENAI|nr:hypothetical protein PENARI_c048G04172 [Penicillium arizonense]OGE47349.1 hypothetical protein PENARI_c048G04172 [Penicillium arizonense]